MKKLLFFQFLLLFILSFNMAAYADNKTVTVTIEAVGLSKKNAIKEGLKEAVEEARGMVISSNTLVVDGKVVSDKSLVYSDGYVSDYKIIKEEVIDKRVHVTLTATVVIGNAFDNSTTRNLDNGTKDNNSVIFKDNRIDNSSEKQSIIDSKNNNKENFKSIVKQHIPKIISNYKDAYEFNLKYKLLEGLNNQVKFKTVPIEIKYTVSINEDKYNKVTSELISFLNNIGIRDKNGDYDITINHDNRAYTYKVSEEEFTILEEVLDLDYRFFSVAFLDKTKKELDSFNMDSFIPIISIKDKSIVIKPILISSNTEKYVKTIFADPKILDQTYSLLGKIGNKRDLGFLIGIRGEYVDKGFKINEVDEKSPAMIAGLLREDVIVNIDNIQVFTNTKIYDIINNLKDGYHKIEVIRDGLNYVVDVYPVRRLNNYKPYM